MFFFIIEVYYFIHVSDLIILIFHCFFNYVIPDVVILMLLGFYLIRFCLKRGLILLLYATLFHSSSFEGVIKFA